MIFLMILVVVMLLKDPDPGGRKVPDRLMYIFPNSPDLLWGNISVLRKRKESSETNKKEKRKEKFGGGEKGGGNEKNFVGRGLRH